MGRIRKIKNAENLIKEYPWLISEPRTNYFKNDNLLEIEIGSGKGIFLITKALNNPHINYIGIERDSTIVLKALKKINQLANKPTNLLIINDNADNLEKWFTKNSINVIYLNFSDPWPKKRHEKNRLTYHTFLKIYYDLLKKHGIIELKTDKLDFYNYSLNSFDNFPKFKKNNSTLNLYENVILLKNNVQTEYEQKFTKQNIKIKKAKFERI